MRSERMGRLARPPHPVLFELLYAPQLAADKVKVLPDLLRIDAAHVAMLGARGLLPRDDARRLLEVNRDLARRVAAGEDVLGSPPVHRGIYMLYEGELVERLGSRLGGAVHTARSRNDINATLSRMALRRTLLSLLAAAVRLLDVELTLALDHRRTLMSGFTHLQPAQPSSFGHYLAAGASELTRAVEALSRLYDEVNRCPMGAAAALGTSFPIDRDRVARLLAFDAPVALSLDAVTSRDYLVRVLSEAALVGSTLGRQALDLQTWGSHAYGFLDWPDELVSTSSIMPQKRNAYVLENVRGRAVAPLGALTATLAGFKNVPFTNSVEVSGEAAGHAAPALAALESAVELTTLLLDHVEVRPQAMRRFLDGAQTTMTAVADLLVREHGVPFRTAHDAVGRLVARYPDASPGEPPAAELAAALAEEVEAVGGERPEIPAAALERALDPVDCLEAAAYGGGPAPRVVEQEVAELRRRLDAVTATQAARRERLDAVDDALERAAADFG